jgi:hypothetical protein
MATEYLPQHDDSPRGVDALGIGPYLAPEPHPVEPDPAVVGRPNHLPNQDSELAVGFGNSRLQVCPRLLQRPSVLQRQVDSGQGLSLISLETSQQRHVATQRITPVMGDHTIKRPTRPRWTTNSGGQAYGSRPAYFASPITPSPTCG